MHFPSVTRESKLHSLELPNYGVSQLENPSEMLTAAEVISLIIKGLFVFYFLWRAQPNVL